MGRALRYFWIRHPALYYALHLYLGVSLALQGVWVALAALVPMWWPFASWRRTVVGGALLALAFYYLSIACPRPTLTKEGVDVKGELLIRAITPSRALFGKGWSIEGFFKSKEGRIPLFVQWPRGFGRPAADERYQVEGCLLATDRGGTLLKVARFEGLGRRATLAEWRFKAKERVTAYIRKQMAGGVSASFLAGLVTGNLSDPALLFAFGRLGLSHLMAISGFHFSILALLLAIALRPWLPQVRGTLLLALLLTGYFLFVGMAPSVQRAWVMAILALLATLIGRKSRALNNLGVALIAALATDPYAVASLGFQFSFGCTASILLWYRPWRRWLCRLIPSYPLKFLLDLPTVEQWAFIVSALLRVGLAMMLAVNMVALPLTLYHFHRFPLMGLVYNLFFPPIVTLLLIGFALAVALNALFWPLGHLAFKLLDGATTLALNLVYEFPPLFDFKLRLQTFPADLLAPLLILLTTLGIWARQRIDRRYKRRYIEIYESPRPAVL